MENESENPQVRAWLYELLALLENRKVNWAERNTESPDQIKLTITLIKEK